MGSVPEGVKVSESMKQVSFRRVKCFAYSPKAIDVAACRWEDTVAIEIRSPDIGYLGWHNKLSQEKTNQT